MGTGTIAVVTDSAASLPRELASELGIEVVPLYLRLGDETLADGVGADDFYSRLRREGTASTSTPSPGDFVAAFERTGAEEILCVTVAASVSGIHDAARIAARTATARVEVLDSGSASMGEGFVALEAARTAREGGSLEAVVARARSVAERTSLVAAIDTFEYLRRSGRVSRLASYAGTMLEIKPVFVLERGEIRPVARPRTRSRAIERVAAFAAASIGTGRAHVAAVHADAEDDARDLLDRVASRVDLVERLLARFTPAMGAHTGPGVVGLAYFTEPRPR